MPLPPKTISVDYADSHTQRTLPALFEEWLTDLGYCIRPLSMMQQAAVMASTEMVEPITENDIRELAGDRADELLADIERAQFRKIEDGTFVRSDVRLYWQGIEARDEIRRRKNQMRANLESEEHVFESIEDMNQTLHKEAKGIGRVEPQTVAPLSAHASGGATELERSKRLAEKLAEGQKEE